MSNNFELANIDLNTSALYARAFRSNLFCDVEGLEEELVAAMNEALSDSLVVSDEELSRWLVAAQIDISRAALFSASSINVLKTVVG